MDPALKTALSDVAGAGRQNLELAKRLGGRTLAEFKRLPTQTRLSEPEAAFSISLASACVSTLPLPRISLAMDCSRLSGEKTMVIFALFVDKPASFWLPAQAVRDFAPQFEHNLQNVSPATNKRWVFGMRAFFQDFSAELWKGLLDRDTTKEPGGQASEQPDGRASEQPDGRALEQPDGRASQAASNKQAKSLKQSKAPAAPARLSSHDLLVCLDNSLAQVGLPLRSFLPRTQNKSFFFFYCFVAVFLSHERLGPFQQPGPLLVLALDQARFF